MTYNPAVASDFTPTRKAKPEPLATIGLDKLKAIPAPDVTADDRDFLLARLLPLKDGRLLAEMLGLISGPHQTRKRKHSRQA